MTFCSVWGWVAESPTQTREGKERVECVFEYDSVGGRQAGWGFADGWWLEVGACGEELDSAGQGQQPLGLLSPSPILTDFARDLPFLLLTLLSVAY